VDSGSTDLAELAALIEGHEHVDVRAALIRTDGGWQLVHGTVTAGAPAPAADRSWRYPENVFLERRLPGLVVAALLRKQPQEIDGLKVSTPQPASAGSFHRLAGHRMWSGTSMAWPRTEWDVSPAEPISNRPDGILVGDGPSFLNYEAAFSSFFFGASPSNRANWQRLWRIIHIDRRAWLHRITIAADRMTVAAKGTSLASVSLGLTSPATHIVRPVGRSGQGRPPVRSQRTVH
jgi:hypothetical protein